MKKLNVGILLAFFLIVIGTMLIGGTTFALFTNSAESDDTFFLSGKLAVYMDQDNEMPYFDISNLMPGQSGSNSVTVSNSGTLPIAYNIEATLTGNLAEGPYPLEILIQDKNGNQIPPNGQRLLAPDEQEVLTVIWRMPIEAGNEYQGGSAQMRLHVHASQNLSMEIVNH